MPTALLSKKRGISRLLSFLYHVFIFSQLFLLIQIELYGFNLPRIFGNSVKENEKVVNFISNSC